MFLSVFDIVTPKHVFMSQSASGISNILISTYRVVLLGIPVDKQDESHHYYDYYYPYWNSSVDVREQTEFSIQKL